VGAEFGGSSAAHANRKALGQVKEHRAGLFTYRCLRVLSAGKQLGEKRVLLVED